MEATANEKLKVSTCECCGPSARRAEHAEADLAERGTTGQVSPDATVTKCDCGCECCEP